MAVLKLCFAGFGNVGRAFCGLLADKRAEPLGICGREILVTGVATRSKGTMIDAAGLDLAELLLMIDRFGRFDPAHVSYRGCGVTGMIEKCGADVFIELTTLSIKDAEPATGYIESAFRHGMHVITANKGPEARYFSRLSKKAAEAGKQYLFESAVMDGAPVFNMARECLHGDRVWKIRGILNGTSNFVLDQLEKNISLEDAILGAQKMGIAEADPSMDIDGWDGAAKICALANVIMGANVTPDMARVDSIRGVTALDIRDAGEKGLRIKFVCQAEERDGAMDISVTPQRLPAGDILARVNGSSAAVTMHARLAGEITIMQHDPGILQTAYGVYSDLITLLKRLG